MFVVMAQSCAGEHLGIGHDRDQQSLLASKVANRRVRRGMEGIVAIEEADDRVGVEDYRHSSRRPSTCLRRSPPVSRHPE